MLILSLYILILRKKKQNVTKKTKKLFVPFEKMSTFVAKLLFHL